MAQSTEEVDDTGLYDRYRKMLTERDYRGGSLVSFSGPNFADIYAERQRREKARTEREEAD